MRTIDQLVLVYEICRDGQGSSNGGGEYLQPTVKYKAPKMRIRGEMTESVRVKMNTRMAGGYIMP